MAAVDIKGRDAFSATGSTGDINFSPINLGALAGAGASSGGSASTLLIVAVVAVILFAVW